MCLRLARACGVDRLLTVRVLGGMCPRFAGILTGLFAYDADMCASRPNHSIVARSFVGGLVSAGWMDGLPPTGGHDGTKVLPARTVQPQGTTGYSRVLQGTPGYSRVLHDVLPPTGGHDGTKPYNRSCRWPPQAVAVAGYSGYSGVIRVLQVHTATPAGTGCSRREALRHRTRPSLGADVDHRPLSLE